jgi:hypothetical protein
MKDYEGSNWLDAPWLVTEFYFYRRVAEIFRYFKVRPSDVWRHGDTISCSLNQVPPLHLCPLCNPV